MKHGAALGLGFGTNQNRNVNFNSWQVSGWSNSAIHSMAERYFFSGG